MNTWAKINHYMNINLVFDSYTRLPQPLWLALNIDIDKGNYTGPLFIHLKSAFGMVDHEIILKKTESLWSKSYLANRKQATWNFL